MSDMKFTEGFRRVLEKIDPAANSKMTPENTPIKVLADWGRYACDHLDKLATDRDALLDVAKYAVRFLDPKEVDVEWMKAAIAQANKE